MWNHWLYKQQSPADLLEQGDILQRSDALIQLLHTYHPYYAQHAENRFFVVLTQSCDLVVRGGACAARYIALAPVRPLKTIVQREFEPRLRKIDLGDPYASDSVRADVERFLARLFNNNETGYYYLEAEQGAGLYEAMCGVLALPISLKVEHYQALLQARILGIDDAFQAKLGWLLGQMYSRVGTRDFETSVVKSKVDEVTDSMAVWLEPNQVTAMDALVAKYRAENAGAQIDAAVFESLLKQVPKKKARAIEAVLEVAARIGLAANPSPQRRQLRLALENDRGFAGLF